LSPLQRRHVLCVLRVPFEWLGDTIPFDEFRNRHRSSVEPLDGVLETIEHYVRRPGRVEPFETVPLDILNERRRRALSSFDTSDLELIFVGGLPEVLRQRAGDLSFSPGIRDRTNIGKANGERKPLLDYDPDCDQLKCFDELAHIVEAGEVICHG
jgi:cellulose biosynthesis protein BcsQ